MRARAGHPVLVGAPGETRLKTGANGHLVRGQSREERLEAVGEGATPSNRVPRHVGHEQCGFGLGHDVAERLRQVGSGAEVGLGGVPLGGQPAGASLAEQDRQLLVGAGDLERRPYSDDRGGRLVRGERVRGPHERSEPDRGGQPAEVGVAGMVGDRRRTGGDLGWVRGLGELSFEVFEHPLMQGAASLRLDGRVRRLLPRAVRERRLAVDPVDLDPVSSSVDSASSASGSPARICSASAGSKRVPSARTAAMPSARWAASGRDSSHRPSVVMTDGAHPPFGLESLVVGHVEQGEGGSAGAAVEALHLPFIQTVATDARQEPAGGLEIEWLEHGDGRRVGERVGEAALRTEARHDADDAQRVPAQPRHHLQQLRGRSVEVVEHEEDRLIDRPEHRARERRRVVHRGDRLPAGDALRLVERGTGDHWPRSRRPGRAPRRAGRRGGGRSATRASRRGAGLGRGRSPPRRRHGRRGVRGSRRRGAGGGRAGASCPTPRRRRGGAGHLDPSPPSACVARARRTRPPADRRRTAIR